MRPFPYLLLFALFLILSPPISFADDLQDGFNALIRKDYKTAHKLWLPLAVQGSAYAQYNLGVMYDNGQGVHQD